MASDVFEPQNGWQAVLKVDLHSATNLEDLDFVEAVVEAERVRLLREGVAAARVGLRPQGPKQSRLSNQEKWRLAAMTVEPRKARSVDSFTRNQIYAAHRFRCVSHGRSCDAHELELGHVLSDFEARVLSEALKETSPIWLANKTENRVPQCRPCNQLQRDRSFTPAQALAAWRMADDEQRPMSADVLIDIMAVVKKVEEWRG
jgi:hypothetical protein